MQPWVSSAFEKKEKKARRWSRKGLRGRRTGYHEGRWALVQTVMQLLH